MGYSSVGYKTGSSSAIENSDGTYSAAFSDNVKTKFKVTQGGVTPEIEINDVVVAQTFVSSLNKTIWFNDLPGIDNGRIGCFNTNNNGNTGHFQGFIDNVVFNNGTSDVSQFLFGNGLNDNFDDDISDEWVFTDQVGSNDIQTSKYYFTSVQQVTPL